MLRKLIAAGALAAVIVTGLPALSLQPAMAQTTRCAANVIVQPGDTLYSIAARCGVPVAQLMRLNPQIGNPNSIQLGSTIRLAPAPGPSNPPPPNWGNPGQQGTTHVIRPGETLSSIGRQYGVSVNQIMAANRHISNPNAIAPGIRLTIPARGTAPWPQPQPQPIPQPQPQQITINGILTGEGVTCQTLRDNNGRLYTLTGNTRWFVDGDRVTVTGRTSDFSICQQGTTIEIQQIQSTRG